MAGEGSVLNSLLSRAGEQDLAAELAGHDAGTRHGDVPKGLSRVRLFLPPGEDPMASPLLGLNPPPAPGALDADDPINPMQPNAEPPALRQRDLSNAFNSLPAALRPSYAPVVVLGQHRAGVGADGNARGALMQAATFMREALADDAAAHPHWPAHQLPGQDLSHATPEERATAASLSAQRTVGSEVVRRASNRLGLGSLLHNQARQMPSETGTHAAAVDFAAAREEGSARQGDSTNMLLARGSSAGAGTIAQGIRTASAGGRRPGTSSSQAAGEETAGVPTSSQAKRRAHAGDTAVFTLGGEVGVRSKATTGADEAAGGATRQPWWERHHAGKGKASTAPAAPGNAASADKAPLPAVGGGAGTGSARGDAAQTTDDTAEIGSDVYTRLAQDTKSRSAAHAHTAAASSSPALRKNTPLKPIARAPKPVVVRSQPKPKAKPKPAFGANPLAANGSSNTGEASTASAPGAGKAAPKTKGPTLLARMEANALATRGSTTRRVVAGGTALKAYSSTTVIPPGKSRTAMPLPSPVQVRRKGGKGAKSKKSKPSKAPKTGDVAQPNARAGTSDPSQRVEGSDGAEQQDTTPKLPARKTVSSRANSPQQPTPSGANGHTHPLAAAGASNSASPTSSQEHKSASGEPGSGQHSTSAASPDAELGTSPSRSEEQTKAVDETAEVRVPSTAQHK